MAGRPVLAKPRHGAVEAINGDARVLTQRGQLLGVPEDPVTDRLIAVDASSCLVSIGHGDEFVGAYRLMRVAHGGIFTAISPEVNGNLTGRVVGGVSGSAIAALRR